MAITYGDHLIDIGANDITPEQEREADARDVCARRGIDPDEVCADGGVLAWMVVDKELHERAMDRVLSELRDRRLLNDVDDDLHQEIAEALVKSARLALSDKDRE